jgi:hypothetical protein
MKKILACAALAVAAPALLSAEVYVPFASNRTISGTTYRTRLWVTNTGAADRRFTTSFIVNGTSGAALTGKGPSLNLVGGGTMLLGTLTPNGKIGMLEVAGAPQLVVNARLDAIGPNDQVLSSTNLPVVSSQNLFKAGTTAHLQGAEITARGTVTDLGVINFSREAARCTINAYRANSTRIASTVQLGLLPLQQRHFDGALTTLGEFNLNDARFAVSCDKPFFPYAIVYRVGGPETSFVVPSGTTEGVVVPPATDGGVTSPDTAVTLTLPGTFLTARAGDSYKQVELPVRPGVRYKRATVDYDLYVNRFPDGVFAGIQSLRRNDRTLFYGLLMRPDRTKSILDLGVDDDLVLGSNGGPWAERTQYHVSVDYNAEARTLTYRLSKGGAVVETLSGRLNHTDLEVNDGKKLYVDFGMTGIADGAYFPPIGWIYSNLSVRLVP